MPYDNSDPSSNVSDPLGFEPTATLMAAKHKPRHADGYLGLIRMRRLANGLLAAIMGLFVFSHLADHRKAGARSGVTCARSPRRRWWVALPTGSR